MPPLLLFLSVEVKNSLRIQGSWELWEIERGVD